MKICGAAFCPHRLPRATSRVSNAKTHGKTNQKTPAEDASSAMIQIQPRGPPRDIFRITPSPIPPSAAPTVFGAVLINSFSGKYIDCLSTHRAVGKRRSDTLCCFRHTLSSFPFLLNRGAFTILRVKTRIAHRCASRYIWRRSAPREMHFSAEDGGANDEDTHTHTLSLLHICVWQVRFFCSGLLYNPLVEELFFALMDLQETILPIPSPNRYLKSNKLCARAKQL